MKRGLYRRGGKRLFDFCVAAGGLCFFALPILWIAWRIHRKMGPPVFFRQIRVGYQGKEFLVTKFRTMSEDGKVTPFGHQLRLTAMDELPQLIHIFKGQMSFVGPRPLIPVELEDLRQFPGGEQRLQVRPGLGGLAQLYGEKVPTLARRLRWDLVYVNRCSLRLDLWILFQSLAVTLRGSWEGGAPQAPPEGF